MPPLPVHSPSTSPEAPVLAQLIVRAADCLRAVLHTPTNEAGLNETRYNVLDLLHREPAGSCSQSCIASRLLQSESNLSTLLDRMHSDGLIARTRSSTDRRRVAISLTPTGRESLARADQRRARAAAEVLQALDEPARAALGGWLWLLIRSLECALGAEQLSDSELRRWEPRDSESDFSNVAGAGPSEGPGHLERDANGPFSSSRPAA